MALSARLLFGQLSAFSARLDRVIHFSRLYKSSVYAKAIVQFDQVAEALKKVFGRKITLRVTDNSIKMLDSAGVPLKASARRINYLLKTGNLVEMAKAAKINLKLSKNTVSKYSTYVKNKPSAKFAARTTGMLDVSDSLSDATRTVLNEKDFVRKVSQVPALADRVKTLGKVLASPAARKLGGLIVVSGVGLGTYSYLNKYAAEASGCYLTTRDTDSSCRVVRYSVTKKSNTGDCVSYHQPNGTLEETYEGACSNLCNDEALDVDPDYAHYECVQMDVWDALGDVTNKLATKVGVAAGKVASGLFGISPVSFLQSVAFVGLVGVTCVYGLRNARKRKYM